MNVLNDTPLAQEMSILCQSMLGANGCKWSEETEEEEEEEEEQEEPKTT